MPFQTIPFAPVQQAQPAFGATSLGLLASGATPQEMADAQHGTHYLSSASERAILTYRQAQIATRAAFSVPAAQNEPTVAAIEPILPNQTNPPPAPVHGALDLT